ncbi:MAG: DMT family transporter [Pseudomonadota bacterium]
MNSQPLSSLSLASVAPVILVLVWSTGWISAKYADPFSGPLTFLFFRFLFSIAVFVGLALVLKRSWPRCPVTITHALLSGALLHTLYLGGIWWAIEQGVPASVSGLLAALQPLMTAMIAYWIVGERLTSRQKLGLLIGFGGLLVALTPKLATLQGQALAAAILPLAINALAMASVTIGTVYQKRSLQKVDLVTVASLQYIGAAVFMVPAILLVEPEMYLEWNVQTSLVMIWSVLGLSLGAVLLLLYLIGRGEVSRAASLIYLIPPTVGFQAWLLFDEEITLPLLIGTAIVVTGVWMVNQKKAQQTSVE